MHNVSFSVQKKVLRKKYNKFLRSNFPVTLSLDSAFRRA